MVHFIMKNGYDFHKSPTTIPDVVTGVESLLTY